MDDKGHEMSVDHFVVPLLGGLYGKRHTIARLKIVCKIKNVAPLSFRSHSGVTKVS